MHTVWATSRPVWAYGSVFGAVLFFAALLGLQYARDWSFEEKFYLPMYVKTSVRAWQMPTNKARYVLIDVVNEHGQQRLALDGEVEPIVHADGTKAYAITAAAVAYGWVKPAWQHGVYRDRDLHAYLGHWIYHDQPLSSHLKRPAYAALILWTVLLFFAIPLDRKPGRAGRKSEQKTATRYSIRYSAILKGLVIALNY
jgi:hypothetical protein